MADGTHIQWTDATWNPIAGCSIKSPGCTNCYAQGLAGTRLAQHPLYAGTTSPSKAGPVFNGHLTKAADEHAVWTWPLRWRGSKEPKLGPGAPSMIFVGDMADLFHGARPREDIDRVVAGIIYSRHVGQFLTKRADVMRGYFTELHDSGRWTMFPHPLIGKPNFAPEATYEQAFARVWLGVSVEDQERADERIPLLLKTPAAVRFISAEPLLGPLDISPYLGHDPLYGRKQTERGVRLSGGALRGFRDQAGRDDLAGSQTRVGPVEGSGGQPPMQESAGRTRRRGVFSDQDHDRWSEGLRPGAPAGVSPLQGADPGWVDDQSRGRHQEAQSSRQPGVGNAFGATDPRHQDFDGGARRQSERREEQHGHIDRRSGERDTPSPGIGRTPDLDSEGLRGRVSDRLEDRARGAPRGIIWCISGGESGPGARPMHPDWARALRDQCRAAGVPFFFKQWGEWAPYDRGRIDSTQLATPGSTDEPIQRFGKRAAGRLLDGREHSEFPA